MTNFYDDLYTLCIYNTKCVKQYTKYYSYYIILNMAVT